MKKMVFVLIVLSTMLALVACGETGALSLSGPSSVARDDFAYYSAKIEGATPLIGIVSFQPYVDLNGDGFYSFAERLGDARWSEVDRFGIAETYFAFTPDAFFTSKGETVPSSTTVIVTSHLYWNNLTAGYEYDRVAQDLTITSD